MRRAWLDDPAAFRAALTDVAPRDRDVWVDRELALDDLPADGPDLPRGCVPYLPCPVDALLAIVDEAAIGVDDVVVDLGSGLGRALAVLHLLTGADTIGIEIQPALDRAARELAARVSPRITSIRGDAVTEIRALAAASVFFLYCPFSGERLRRVLDELEVIARVHPIRVCCVDLPLPSVPWLVQAPAGHRGVGIYRSVAAAR